MQQLVLGSGVPYLYRYQGHAEFLRYTQRMETVNGRMENCGGGGQRLPPDGDEFPTEYQEFGKAVGDIRTLDKTILTDASPDDQEYRFISTNSTMTMTMTERSCPNIANVTYPAREKHEPFHEKESLKLMTIETNSTRNNLLQDTCQVNGKVTSSANCDILAGKKTLTSHENLYISEGVTKINSPSLLNYSSNYAQNQANGNMEISERKIEITGYYQKDISHREKDNTTETPPPLPLTGPPKMEAKNGPGLEQSPRKFSLNGELWRQDDKSEKSVRDKIAMFSSQSNLDAPVFPSNATVVGVGITSNTSSPKRLSKYKSSEDVCASEEKIPATTGQREKALFFAERTQSSFDLTDSARNVPSSCPKYTPQRSVGNSTYIKPILSVSHTSKVSPVVPQKSSSCESSKIYAWSSQGDSWQDDTLKPIQTSSSGLARATSFSGSTPHGTNPSNELSGAGSQQISRTNSLASTFKRPAEDIRKTSLNQLIEQRRRSISKLRGLVIPEKEAIPIDQPIVDLPEIKSRDLILNHQLPKSNLQDKWGSQSSLASNASATSCGATKVTASFKMPAPQINSKYSPAFKRKSLTVYGISTSASTINGGKSKSSPSSCINGGLATPVTTGRISSSAILAGSPVTTFSTEAPKSLESICSPTRSDYSFDFVSASNSPEGLHSKGRIVPRKTRMDYDDSDNDSAVSSSQSSISRGFSPPMSPVPSERSTISSERSYLSTETHYQRRSLIMESSGRTSSSSTDLGAKSNLSDRSPPSSSSSNSNSRNSQIPQRQPLRRSNSTDTNCSTSSTLTSGSQASAESLSRRVLKPQSVEAINRKNILASARCRSGRELNGSPLIQRKFLQDEQPRYVLAESEITNTSELTNHVYSTTESLPTGENVKVAYIELTDSFVDDEPLEDTIETGTQVEPKLPPKRSIPQPAARPPKSEMLEASNDLRMWVRAEAKALESKVKLEDRTRQEDPSAESDESYPSSPARWYTEGYRKETKLPESRPISTDQHSDLLTILTTKSRSRSAIHVDAGTLARSKSQMSLEDILGAKTKGTTNENEKNPGVAKKYWTVVENEPGTDEKAFLSKIPTYGRAERRLAQESTESVEPQVEIADRNKSTVSKIPTANRSASLTRRSASVTDMKKALEKTESSNSGSVIDERNTATSSHSRFPSLDSSVEIAVEENAITSLRRSHLTDPLDRCTDSRRGLVGNLLSNPSEHNGPTNPDVERYSGEQFGSISSLASSTSLISQQELAQLVEEANLEDVRSPQDVIVVLLHKEKPTGSVGITLAGGADCEVKEITVHRVLAHSLADKDGRLQRGDRILSINGRSTRGLTHRESLAVLKQPRSEVVLVVSRARPDETCKLRSRTTSVETIIEGFELNGVPEDIAWGPPSVVAVYKDGAGLGFSLEGGRDSPLGDRALVIKKIFTGGAAEKTGALKAGDQLLEVNGNDVTRMSRIEAWSFMKKLHDGEVNLLVRHPAIKSS